MDNEEEQKEEKEEEEGRKLVTIQAWSIELPEERSVTVGYNLEDPTDDSYYFRFKNKGVEKTVRLSPEAFTAAIQIKDTVDAARGLGRMLDTVVRWVEAMKE